MIAQFALRLICGMSLMWALMPRRQVSSGFFRIQMLVVMGLGVLAALSLEMPQVAIIREPVALGHIIAITTTAFLGSVLWTVERRNAAEWAVFWILALSIGLLLSMDTTHDAWKFLPSSWPVWLRLFSDLISAAVLGATVVGMLLGHWYLTTPTMSIEPLNVVNKALGIVGVARLLVSSAAIYLVWNGAFDPSHGTPAIARIPSMWLSLRWLAGVVGPLGVSLMVWRILKYRNTQAATGVLFVGVILAFIGDMTAALLLRETGLPL